MKSLLLLTLMALTHELPFQETIKEEKVIVTHYMKSDLLGHYKEIYLEGEGESETRIAMRSPAILKR